MTILPLLPSITAVRSIPPVYGHPKDKALVENAVKLLYRSVYLDIEGMTFSSLDDLNAAIHVSLNDFNEKVMAGREASRKEMFLRGEKDYLRPLPLKRYVMKEKKLMTVGRNSYVSLFKAPLQCSQGTCGETRDDPLRC